MTVNGFLKKFAKDETGAVTSDWVVITAIVVGMGVMVVAPIGSAISGGGEKIKFNIMDSVSESLSDTKL